MNIEQYAYIAEIVGMIIVVVTLIFIAIQSQQNGALLRSEARRIQVSNDIELLFKFMEFPEIAQSFSSPGKIEYEKKLQLYFWLIAFCRAREHQWFEYRKGVLDETAWKSYSKVIPWAFGTDRNRRLWKSFRENFDPEFVAIVDKMIEGPPLFVEFWKEFAEND